MGGQGPEQELRRERRARVHGARRRRSLAPSRTRPPARPPAAACRCRSPTRSRPAARATCTCSARAGVASSSPAPASSTSATSSSCSSGNYKTTYKLTAGPNPENSLVTGAVLPAPLLRPVGVGQHPGHRAGRERRRHPRPAQGAVRAGRSAAAARTRSTPAKARSSRTRPGRCARSARTSARTAARTRSATHIFYDRREDIRTNLRVHAIPGIMDFFDYSPAASGMTYRNNLNPAGVTIDGDPDRPSPVRRPGSRSPVAQGSLTRVGADHDELHADRADVVLPRRLDPARDPVHRRRVRVRLERALVQRRRSRAPIPGTAAPTRSARPGRCTSMLRARPRRRPPRSATASPNPSPPPAPAGRSAAGFGADSTRLGVRLNAPKRVGPRASQAGGVTRREVMPLTISMTCGRLIERNIASAARLSAPATSDGVLPSAAERVAHDVGRLHHALDLAARAAGSTATPACGSSRDGSRHVDAAVAQLVPEPFGEHEVERLRRRVQRDLSRCRPRPRATT